MHRICFNLKFTNRKQPDIKSALNITLRFKAFAPDDPAKFDFALTRLSMNKKNSLDILLNNYIITTKSNKLTKGAFAR
jgi:hypothetical protein